MNKILLLLGALLVLTTPAGAAKSVDSTIESSLKKSSTTPSEICTDEVYVRRLYLTLAGKLPTLEESRDFLESKQKNRRAELIDKLLESDDFVYMQRLKWGDLLKVKSEFPSNIWPNGVQAYNRWITEHIRANTPYDEFVRDLLTATGSNFRTPQVSFYRAFVQRTPEAIAENVELLFLGRREPQPAAAQFFEQVRFKKTGEWKEEIVSVDVYDEPKENRVTMSDGRIVELQPKSDIRCSYVEWLTSPENREFARVMANRVWYWMMGRGIVHEPDDFRADNPPSNSELIELLTDKFIEVDYDVRALMRIILNSRAYQRSSLSTPNNRERGAELFAYYPTTRLTAEQIIDGISLITGINDRYVSRVPEPYSYFPADLTSAQIGDATVSSPQLDLFGRPSRDYSLENQRSNAINSKQTLYLLNSNSILSKIGKSKLLDTFVNGCQSQEDVIIGVYLMLLSRYPTIEEVELINKSSTIEDGRKVSNRELANTLVWALINSSEFLFNH